MWWFKGNSVKKKKNRDRCYCSESVLIVFWQWTSSTWCTVRLIACSTQPGEFLNFMIHASTFWVISVFISAAAKVHLATTQWTEEKDTTIYLLVFYIKSTALDKIWLDFFYLHHKLTRSGRKRTDLEILFYYYYYLQAAATESTQSDL